MNIAELTTIGLSEKAHNKLKWLQEGQHFRERLDAYRFAVGLALAQGVEPPEIRKRKTIFNVGTFDPDQSFKHSIEALMSDRLQDTSVYRMAERLAEWGVNKLTLQAKDGTLNFEKLLRQADEKAASDV